jgi:hypothetical protein
MGNVTLQMSANEVQRIDNQVAWHRTKEATYGTYLHEWALSKGKEKGPPELVYYWNGSFQREVEAEVDLYLHHLYAKKAKTNSVSVLQYTAHSHSRLRVPDGTEP